MNFAESQLSAWITILLSVGLSSRNLADRMSRVGHQFHTGDTKIYSIFFYIHEFLKELISR